LNFYFEIKKYNSKIMSYTFEKYQHRKIKYSETVQLDDWKFKVYTILDKPGKLTHLRRMKLTMANGLPRFDLSLG
jgi:hypothetical protein